MKILRDEIIHFSCSILLAMVVSQLWNVPLGAYLGAIIGGFFVDADHLFDYYVAYGTDFNLKRFLSGKAFFKDHRVYVPLHGWEFVIIFFLLGANMTGSFVQSFLIAYSGGLFLHLVVDTFTNNVTVQGYSLLYRISIGFSKNKIHRRKKLFG